MVMPVLPSTAGDEQQGSTWEMGRGRRDDGIAPEHTGHKHRVHGLALLNFEVFAERLGKADIDDGERGGLHKGTQQEEGEEYRAMNI